MKVKDFIEDLKKYNPNAKITLPTSETICLSYICQNLDGKPLTKKTTPIVFIEGIDECFEEEDCSFGGIPNEKS